MSCSQNAVCGVEQIAFEIMNTVYNLHVLSKELSQKWYLKMSRKLHWDVCNDSGVWDSRAVAKKNNFNRTIFLSYNNETM